MTSDRYAGKPFLRLLECYLLNAIGKLTEDQRSSLQRMEPKLREIYGTNGSWVDVVAEQMNLDANFSAQLVVFWNGYAAQAKENGMSSSAEEFAVQFIDQNFPEIT